LRRCYCCCLRWPSFGGERVLSVSRCEDCGAWEHAFAMQPQLPVASEEELRVPDRAAAPPWSTQRLAETTPGPSRPRSPTRRDPELVLLSQSSTLGRSGSPPAPVAAPIDNAHRTMGPRHALLLALAVAGAAARPVSSIGEMRGDLVRVDFYMEALWRVTASSFRSRVHKMCRCAAPALVGAVTPTASPLRTAPTAPTPPRRPSSRCSRAACWSWQPSAISPGATRA
jgi:hypothetical protein